MYITSDEETRALANKKQDLNMNPGSRKLKVYDLYTGLHCLSGVEESIIALIINSKSGSIT